MTLRDTDESLPGQFQDHHRSPARARLGREPIRRDHVKIRVSTDKNVVVRADFAERTAVDVASALARFERRLTRVEVHLRDESAGPTTGEDIRCLLEARPAGLDPVAVTYHATTVSEALRGATERLAALLSSKLDRLESRSRETIRRR